MKKTVTHETIFVDFQKRTVVKVQKKKIKLEVREFDFSNFNPVPEDSNFAYFSDEERMEYSDHVLEYIHEAEFADLVHWANMGMLDLKKANEKLGLFNSKKAKKVSKK